MHHNRKLSGKRGNRTAAQLKRKSKQLEKVGGPAACMAVAAKCCPAFIHPFILPRVCVCGALQAVERSEKVEVRVTSTIARKQKKSVLKHVY